ncbi:MAG: hypothetical protein U0736_23520 [Gemmataceae bacterium]
MAGPHSTTASLDGEGEVFYGDVECLVTDARSLMRPADVVEERLVGLMRGGPLLVSQVQHPSRSRYGPR